MVISMKKTILFISITVVVFGSVLLVYKNFLYRTPVTVISSQSVLTALKKQGFFISQTYIFNQKVDIENSSGSEWKDIFWGQKITASGNIKVSSGVDLRKLQDQDVEIRGKEIIIALPAVERYSVELMGDIILTNKQGFLKQLFDNDDGYNTAYARLKEEAEKAANASEVVQEAEENAQNEIIKLITMFDEKKEVHLFFKK